MKGLDNSLSAQRLRVLERLRKGSLTRFEAEKELDVVSLAPRIFELRHDHGHNIIKTWDMDYTSKNRPHKVARYVLLPGKWQGGNQYA